MQTRFMNILRSHPRSITAMVVIALLALSGLTYYQLLVFHSTGTSPSLTAVSNHSPYLKINYNQELNSGSLKLSDPSHIFSSKSVKGKTITLNFANTLTIGKSYQFTIIQIANSSGKVLENHEITFTAKDIPVTKLSNAQQTTLVARQDQYPYEVDYISYTGFDALVDNGMSADQLASTKQALFDYSNTVKQHFWEMTLITGTIQVQLHDSTSDSTIDSQSFDVQLGASKLHAIASYDLLSDNTQLQLLNASGAVVFDTANAHD